MHFYNQNLALDDYKILQFILNNNKFSKETYLKCLVSNDLQILCQGLMINIY